MDRLSYLLSLAKCKGHKAFSLAEKHWQGSEERFIPVLHKKAGGFCFYGKNILTTYHHSNHCTIDCPKKNNSNINALLKSAAFCMCSLFIGNKGKRHLEKKYYTDAQPN